MLALNQAVDDVKSSHSSAARAATKRHIAMLHACALFGAGCGAKASISVGSSTTASVPSEDLAIVWWREGEHARSALIEGGGAGHRVRARRNEIVIAASGSLWAVRKRPVERVSLCRSCDCMLGNAQPTDDCSVVRTTISTDVLVRLRDGKILGAPERSPAEETCSMTEYEPSVEVEASAGSSVVVTTHTYLNGCGAHGMYADTVGWFDLDKATAIATPTPEPTETADFERRAREQFAEGPEGCIDSATPEITFYATHIANARSGRATLEYEYTTPTAYVCGTGPGHYAQSTRVGSSARPSGQAYGGDVPRFVVSFLRTLPSESVIGGISIADARATEQFVTPEK